MTRDIDLIEIRGSGSSWALYQKGRPLSKRASSKDNAELMAHSIKTNARVKVRPCIRCRREFTSSWSGHRMYYVCSCFASGAMV
jgi:hypothetical protein